MSKLIAFSALEEKLSLLTALSWLKRRLTIKSPTSSVNSAHSALYRLYTKERLGDISGYVAFHGLKHSLRVAHVHFVTLGVIPLVMFWRRVM